MEKGIIAIGAGLTIAIAAAIAALAISSASSKAFDATSRQPEVAAKIQSMLMISIVFIESCVIYALVVALLILFVL